VRLVIDKKEGKGRAFSAELVAYAEADPLWNTTDTKNHRPIWAVFAGPAEQLRAFSANLLLGHLATDGKDRDAERFEFLKSAGYRAWTRPLPAGGVAVTFCLPHLLSWQVPQDEELHHKFAVIPALELISGWTFDLDVALRLLLAMESSAFNDGIGRREDGYDWSTQTSSYSPALKIDDLEGHKDLHRFLSYGALLLHYLEHRLPQPLPRSPVFGAWLFLLGIEQGCVRSTERQSEEQRRYSRTSAYVVTGAEKAGAADGFTFNGAHLGGSSEKRGKAIAEWIGAEVVRWHKIGGGL
jgi:hypothetical protein